MADVIAVTEMCVSPDQREFVAPNGKSLAESFATTNVWVRAVYAGEESVGFLMLPDDGESLLGELFRVAFEARSRCDIDRADARPWLYGIATNLVMKHLRAERRPH